MKSSFMKETEWSWLSCLAGAQHTQLEGRRCSPSQGLSILGLHAPPVSAWVLHRYPGFPPQLPCVRTRVHLACSVQHLALTDLLDVFHAAHVRHFFSMPWSSCVSALQCADTTRHSGLTRPVYFSLIKWIHIHALTFLRFYSHPAGEGGCGLLRNVKEIAFLIFFSLFLLCKLDKLVNLSRVLMFNIEILLPSRRMFVLLSTNQSKNRHLQHFLPAYSTICPITCHAKHISSIHHCLWQKC